MNNSSTKGVITPEGARLYVKDAVQRMREADQRVITPTVGAEGVNEAGEPDVVVYAAPLNLPLMNATAESALMRYLWERSEI